MKKGEKKSLTKKEKELIVKVVETLIELKGFEYKEPTPIKTDLRTGKSYTPSEPGFWGLQSDF